MSVKKPIGNPNILQKRLVANPKYEGVGTTVDTGLTVNHTKALKEAEVTTKQGAGELFRRMRPSSLANLLNKKLQQAQLEQQMAGLSMEEAAHVRMAMGEPDAVMQQHEAEYPIPKAPQKEILLLDLRPKEEFDACHIGSAVHYPAAMLSRAMNQFTPEILHFKNKENAIIVLYDLEEELLVAQKRANVFIERGFDNVIILSGGLREFVQEQSHLIVGESPVPIVPKPQAVVNGRRQLASRSANSVSGGSTMGTSVASSHKPKSLSSSLARRREPGSGGSAWH